MTTLLYHALLFPQTNSKMALRSIVKKTVAPVPSTSRSVVDLYRQMIRELPRVMSIYDIDLPNKEAVAGVQYHFRKNSYLKDQRVIALLVSKGYMELEETLLQWKQKSHLMDRLQPAGMIKSPPITPLDQVYLGNTYQFK